MMHLLASCPVTGQHMSTWMMHSMSTLASTEMQQQYANEIMEQQIFKICQENTKMESTIILTNTSMAAENSVEKALVAILSTTDTETNSGVTEQCHNTMNDEDHDDIDVITPTQFFISTPA